MGLTTLGKGLVFWVDYLPIFILYLIFRSAVIGLTITTYVAIWIIGFTAVWGIVMCGIDLNDHYQRINDIRMVLDDHHKVPFEGVYANRFGRYLLVILLYAVSLFWIPVQPYADIVFIIATAIVFVTVASADTFQDMLLPHILGFHLYTITGHDQWKAEKKYEFRVFIRQSDWDELGEFIELARWVEPLYVRKKHKQIAVQWEMPTNIKSVITQYQYWGNMHKKPNTTLHFQGKTVEGSDRFVCTEGNLNLILLLKNFPAETTGLISILQSHYGSIPYEYCNISNVTKLYTITQLTKLDPSDLESPTSEDEEDAP